MSIQINVIGLPMDSLVLELSNPQSPLENLPSIQMNTGDTIDDWENDELLFEEFEFPEASGNDYHVPKTTA